MNTIDPDGTYLKRNEQDVLIKTYYAGGFSWVIFGLFGSVGIV